MSTISHNTSWVDIAIFIDLPPTQSPLYKPVPTFDPKDLIE